MTKAVAVDDTTLKVYCSQPKANMLTTQIYIYVLPEHIWGKLSVKELGNTFRNPTPIVGSGPFQTVEFKKDQYVKMVRNPTYWGTQPTVDEIVFEYYTNSDTMVQDLKSGTIDGAQVIPPEQFKRLEGEPGIKTIAYPLYNWEYIDVNCYDSPNSLGNPVLKDPKFRVAMAWAIDREKCAVLGWSGFAQGGYGIFPQKGWPASADPYYQPDAASTIGFDLEKAKQLMDAAGYKDTDGDGIREDKGGKPIKLRLWARDISPESQVQGKLIAGWLKDIGLDIDYSVVDEGALGDSIWNYKGDTYAPDYDLALWDFMGYIDPGDSAACFTTDQIENYNEMNWSNAEYDRLTVAQYKEMDPAKRMDLLKQAQAVMYAEQPMIVIDYPSVLQAVNTSRWDGWQPYVGGSVWANMIDRQSYLELKPKVAEAAASGGGSSSKVGWVAVVVAAIVGAFVVVWLKRRGGGRAVGGMTALPGDYHVHTTFSDGTGSVEECVATSARGRPPRDRHRRPHRRRRRRRTSTGGSRRTASPSTATRSAPWRRGTTTSGSCSGSKPSTSRAKRRSWTSCSTAGRSRSSCSACTSWTASRSTTRPCAATPAGTTPTRSSPATTRS